MPLNRRRRCHIFVARVTGGNPGYEIQKMMARAGMVPKPLLYSRAKAQMQFSTQRYADYDADYHKMILISDQRPPGVGSTHALTLHQAGMNQIRTILVKCSDAFEDRLGRYDVAECFPVK